MDENKLVPGDIAWLVLTGAIIGYDLAAISTKRVETLSSAIWRSLSHPRKLPILLSIWTALTWHLFANPRARQSYKNLKQAKRGLN